MSSYDKIKLVLIDENELFREGIKRILEGSSLFTVVGEGNSVFDVVALLEERVNIVLKDDQIYNRADDVKIKQFITENPTIKFALFASDDGHHRVLPALEFGIRGYFTKEMNVASLIDGLHAIQQGKYWIHPDITNKLVEEYLQFKDNISNTTVKKRYGNYLDPLTIFTSREYQVLQLLASGYNNKRISKKLNITQSTVKNHVTSIFVKMKVNDRTQAVIRAIQHNWVEIDRVTFAPLEKKIGKRDC